MKKILTLLIVLLPFAANAVVSLGNVTFNGEQHEVTVLMKNENPKYYCFSLPTEDQVKQEIWIKPKDAGKFHAAMYEAKLKFQEWEKIAEENNVGEFEKEMPVTFPKVRYGWGAGELIFANGPFKLRFHRTKEGICTAVLVADVTSNSNNFATKTFIFTILNETEFDTFLNVFSNGNIEKALTESRDSNKNDANDSLFN